MAGGNIDSSSQTKSTSAIRTDASGSTVLASNTSRRYFFIQNLGTNVLFVRLLAGATSSLFDFALKAGSVNDDGTGASIASAQVCFTGDISIAGTSPRFVAVEI